MLDSAPHPEFESRAETIQCDETVTEYPRNEKMRDGRDAATPTLIVQHNSLPGPDNDKRDEEVQTSVFSHSKQPPRPGRHSKILSTHTRSLRSRPNAKSNRPERLPSVSVVIPVRRSDRPMVSSNKPPPTRAQHRRQDASRNHDGENDPAAHDLIEDHEAEERPRKRHKRATRSKMTMGSNSDLANDAAGGCSNLFQKPPDDGFAVTSGETQEAFGRGIIRIQPHGPRHAYVITFLLDIVQPPSMPLTSEMPSEKSSFSDCGSQKRSGSPKVAGKRRHKRMAYLPAENWLLAELRTRRDLPWGDVAKYFKYRTLASLQTQYSKIRRGVVDDS